MEAGVYLDMRRVEDEHWWFVGRRRIVRAALAALRFDGRPRILDAGCGTGGNLAMLAEFGEVTGLELDEQAVRVARLRGAGPVRRGGLPLDVPAWHRRFDLVVMTDVLEHLDDDVGALRSVAAVLRPGGFALLTVPAFQFLWSAQDEANHHRRRYTAAQLRSAIERAGLRTVRLSYINSFLFPAVAAGKLGARMLGRGPARAGLALPPAPLNALLASVFAAERHLLRWAALPIGVSVLAIGRRP
jgi:SAM-dependent methyltransferase